jgi:hypothetical protein
MLVYGDSGIGKTVLAGSSDAVPSMRSVLLLDFEGGTESLRKTYPDVRIVRITNWAAVQDVFNYLHRGDHGIGTVIVDSLTEIQKLNMYWIMQELLRRNESTRVDPDVPSVREWGKNLEQMRKMVRAFRDLPMHTIFTALANVDKDDQTGAISYVPLLSGKLAREIPAFLDVVGYYYPKEVVTEGKSISVRKLLFQPTDRYMAKDRTSMLPGVMSSPTMTKIIGTIYGGN